MPKRLVGGVFLLCLTALTLTLSEDSETYTNITQPEIIEQLTNLKNYISNPSMIKPVWVQLKNGDKIVVVQGEMKVVDTGEFEIIVAFNGYKLLIHVEFTQVLNEDDEPLDDWYIDTDDARYLLTTDYKRVFVEDVKNIDGEILSQLKCGDVVIKHDASGEHAYKVTFKNDTGICLTYVDASCVETQSYDKVGDEWVYNSEDKTELPVNIGNPIQVFDGTDLTPSGLTKTSPFIKCVRNFNELQFIFNIRLENETADTINLTNDARLCAFEIPDEFLKKIYAHNGFSLYELKQQGFDGSVACAMLLVSTISAGMDTDQQPRYVNLYYVGADNKVYFYIEGGTVGIGASETRDLESRISLAL